MSDPSRIPGRTRVPAKAKPGAAKPTATKPTPVSEARTGPGKNELPPGSTRHARQPGPPSPVPKGPSPAVVETIFEAIKSDGGTRKDAHSLARAGITDASEAKAAHELSPELKKLYFSLRPTFLASHIALEDAVPALEVFCTHYQDAGIPLNPKTFPAYTADENDREYLAEGGFNEVFKVKATNLKTAADEEMVFKPAGSAVGHAGERAGITMPNPQLECRNVLASLVAEKLLPDPAENCIAYSRLGMLGTEPGVMMALARGPELNSSSRDGTLNPATAAHRRLEYGKKRLAENSAAMSNYLKQNRLHGVAAGEVEGSWTVVAANKTLPQGLDLNHPELKRKLTWLALIDHLINQVDRHAGNILIVPRYNDKKGIIGYDVVGIDNDQTFGRDLNDPDERMAAMGAWRWTLRFPQVVDQEMHDRIRALKEEDLRELADGLLFDQQELEALGTRLLSLQAHLADLQKKGKVIARDDWDLAVLHNPETSYAAREMETSGAALLEDLPVTKLLLKYPLLNEVARGQTGTSLDPDQFDRIWDDIAEVYGHEKYTRLLTSLKEAVPQPTRSRKQEGVKKALERLQASDKIMAEASDKMRKIEAIEGRASNNKRSADARTAFLKAGQLWLLNVYRAANVLSQRRLRQSRQPAKPTPLAPPPKPTAMADPPRQAATPPVQRKAEPFQGTHPLAQWINSQWPTGVDYFEVSLAQLHAVLETEHFIALDSALEALDTDAARAAKDSLFDAYTKTGSAKRERDATMARQCLDALAQALAALPTDEFEG